MGFIHDELVHASVATGVDISALNVSDTDRIRNELNSKFTERGDISSPLWEQLKDDISIHDEKGWEKVAEFPSANRVILLFDEGDETVIFSVNGMVDIVNLLSECSGFVFYLTDENCNFIICYNDHDYLIATGTATDWIKNKIS